MFSRTLRVLLVVMGVALLGAAILPVFALLHVPEQWETGVIAMKLLMLPVGAICLWAAAGIGTRYRRR